MYTRMLGISGLEVSAIGFGYMGLSHGFGPPVDDLPPSSASATTATGQPA